MNRFFQAIIALSGLAITMLLGLQSIDAQNRATENERLQARYAFMELFSEQTALALQGCKAAPLVFLRIAHSNLPGKVAEDRNFKDEIEAQLKTVEDEVDICSQSEALPPPVQQPGPPPQPGPGAPTPPPVQQAAPEVATTSNNTYLRAKETITKGPASSDDKSAPGPAVATRWYAVLASYQPGAEDKYALHDYANFEKAIAAYGDVPGKLEVYRTSISNHYAIVLTPTGGDKGGALKLAALARNQKWAADAFVQDDRNWTKCPNPGTPDGLAACQKAQS
ncbi:MAG: hypothetical protein QM773_08910 [Hyphomonadaceae bacterium]